MYVLVNVTPFSLVEWGHRHGGTAESKGCDLLLRAFPLMLRLAQHLPNLLPEGEGMRRRRSSDRGTLNEKEFITDARAG